MFLQILGAIFLIILCIVAYYAFKVSRFIKAQKNSDISIAMSVLPSLEMELEPSNAEEWKESERLQFTESELKKIGAAHVGYFCTHSGYATIRISLWNYKNQVVAAIYEGFADIDKDSVSFIYEVSCKLDDGTLCVTSNQHAVYDNRPNNHKLVFKESTSILDLFKAIKSELPDGKKIRRIHDPKSYFEACYEDATEWSWKPEQLKSHKTQQVFSSVGINVSDELMDELIDMGISYSVEVNINRARRKLAKHPKMTADHWEKIRDKLVFVNEHMQVDHLIDAVYDLSGELPKSQQQVLDGFIANTDQLVDPVAAFQMLLQSMNLKAKRITSMDTPVRTEVYLPL